MNVAKLTCCGNTTKIDVANITSELAQMDANSIIYIEYGSKSFAGTVRKALAPHRRTRKDTGTKVPNITVILGLDEK